MHSGFGMHYFFCLNGGDQPFVAIFINIKRESQVASINTLRTNVPAPGWGLNGFQKLLWGWKWSKRLGNICWTFPPSDKGLQISDGFTDLSSVNSEIKSEVQAKHNGNYYKNKEKNVQEVANRIVIV